MTAPLKHSLLVLILVFGVATLYTKFFIPKSTVSEPAVKEVSESGRAASSENNSEEPIGGSIDIVNPALANLFPPNDWRRTSGNLWIIGDDDGFFIFKGEPSLSKDGTTLTFNACTLVVLPPQKEETTDEERYRAAFIFESNESVTLTLDRSLADFTHLKANEFGISSFKEGRVLGKIEVRSAMESPKPDDDFFLSAHDVVFNLQQLVANREVTLRYGRNSCAGTGLRVDLDVPSHLTVKRSRPDASKNQNAKEVDKLVESGNIGGGFSLKSAQLRNITDCFCCYYKESKQDASTDDEQTSFDDPRLEIRCNSDVCFSPNPEVIGGWCARFNGGVDLVSYRKGVKAEQTLCETLYLLLQDPDVEQLAKTSDEIKERLLRKKITGSLSKLVPTTVRAIKKISKDASNEGSQVEVRLEKPKMTLKTNEIVYDLQEKLLNLTGTETRRVQIVTPEELDSTGKLKKLDFSAETVQVQLSEQNELKTIFAGKNGVLKTEFENQKGEKHDLDVSWKEGLRIVPEPQTPNVLRLTSTGNVTFGIDAIGSFMAKEVDFWSKIDLKDDSQQTKKALEVQPVSFVERSSSEDAQNSEKDDNSKNVAIDNIKGVTPISAEFRGGVVFNAPRGQANISDKVVLRFASEFPNEENDAETFAKTPNDSKSFFSDASLTGDKDDSKFEIQCAQMSLWCVFNGANQNNVDLYRLQLQGGVSLVERAINDASEKMRITAEVAKIDRPSSPNASVRLAGQTGAPALFQTKDLELMGADVLVDRATNSFQVLGSGKLDFNPPQGALDAQEKNKELSGFFTNDPIEIRWSNSMILQNNVLCFKANPQDRVVVAQKTQRLECPELRLTLKGGVSLFDGGSFQQKEFDFERLDCVGSYEAPVEFNARMNYEKEEIKDGEIQEAWYYAKFNNLSFLSSEDKIVSNSGGEFRAVMRAKNGFKTVEQFETSKQENNQKNEQKLDWALVHAKFQGELLGSLKLHEATASNGVRLVVGQTNNPNVNIDVDNSSTFPEKFALITGNEASVKINASNVETTQTENAPKAVEIETRNSVVFKSSNVVGRCDTLRYSSQKNAVVMTGSNARNAELYTQEGAGSPKELLAKFSRASYRLDTEDFDVESLSLNENR